MVSPLKCLFTPTAFNFSAMKQFLRDYFVLNRKERNGIFVLLSIILLLVLYLSFSDYFFPKDKIDFSGFEKEITRFEAEQKQISDSVSQIPKNYFTGSDKSDPGSIERFSFNPNNLPAEDWKRLGLSEKQIRIIRNYESKGGEFRKKEDVKKIYCITSRLYASLEPYIQIPASDFKSEFKSKTPLSLEKWTDAIELNSADTAELKKLKGIGSVFAKRIVKFRDVLGGFVKKEQLLEVYGFDKEKYDWVSPHVTLDVSKAKKININSASVEDLNKHPYIDKKAATKIYLYRINHGNYSDVQDILTSDLVDAQLFSKLAGYLTVR